jgi:hypothetical protein
MLREFSFYIFSALYSLYCTVYMTLKANFTKLLKMQLTLQQCAVQPQ